MTSFLRGAGYFLKGLGMLRQPRVRLWAVLPIVVSALLFGCLIYLATGLLQPEISGMESWLNAHLPWLSWMGSFVWFLFAVLVTGVTAYGFVTVAAIVSCPFNPVLAEAAERSRTGRVPKGMPLGRVILGLPVTLVQETKKILYYVFWAVPVLILCLIFLPASPFIWAAFSGWMLALEFTDYPMDNHGLKFRDMRRSLARRRMTSFGFGMAVLGFAMIPVANILTVPGAVCGATLLWLDELQDGETRTS